MYPSLMTLVSSQLKAAIGEACRQRYGVRHGALRPETAAILTDLCDGLSFQPSRLAPVRQSFVAHDFDWPLPAEIDWLVQSTEAVVQAYSQEDIDCFGLSAWQANDIVMQRYEYKWDMIDWHRDYASDIYLIVVYTVSGAATLDFEHSPGQPVNHRVTAGSVCVLLGPDPIFGVDPRVRHRVNPPELFCTRTSIALRMNASRIATSAVLAA